MFDNYGDFYPTMRYVFTSQTGLTIELNICMS